MSEEENSWASSGEAIKPEYFEHQTEGWLSYDPNTLVINDKRDGMRPINHPIMLTGKFFGTKQPLVPSCGEPREGHKGCSKYHGCKIGQMFQGVGPGMVRMEKHGQISAEICHHYFETTRGGRPTSQLHAGMDGWKLNTEDTTFPMLGRSAAVAAGKLDDESSRQAVQASKPRVSWHEIPGLLPPWWPKMLEKGLELPENAKHFPQAVPKKVKSKKVAE